ncbi:MAG: ParA family protein [Flavobacteriaceae bacterium]|nr:ParA family protein [Flavobacteriaceae bacterium]
MPRIITFSHQKGGVGKSTLAYNVAQNISKDAKVCIIDYDKQGSLSQISELVNFDILDNIKVERVVSLDYDFIIIDTPPYLSENLIELFKISDLILVPTRAGILDLFAIRGTIYLIKEAEQDSKAMIVFNLIKPNTTLTSDVQKEMKEFNIKIAETQVSDLVVFTRSILLGGVEGGNAKSQIDSLTKEILEKII